MIEVLNKLTERAKELQENKILKESNPVLLQIRPLTVTNTKKIKRNFTIISNLIQEIVLTNRFKEVINNYNNPLKDILLKLLEFLKRDNSDQLLFWRPDVYIHEEHIKFLELNFGSNLGGLELSLLTRSIYDPDNHTVSSPDMLKAWIEDISFICEKNDALKIYFTDTEEGLTSTSRIIGILQSEMRNSCSDIITEKISLEDYLSNIPMEKHLLYRYCDVSDLTDNTELLDKLINTIQLSHVIDPVPLWGSLYESKSCFALLHEFREQSLLTLGEENVVAESIPFTKFITEETFSWIINYREELVLKPAFGFGGIDVFCGWMLSEDEWKEKIEEIIKEKTNFEWIIQERVKPGIHKANVLINEEVETWTVRELIGPRFHNDRLVGGIIRANQSTETPVVNFRNGAGIGALLLERGNV